MIIYAFLLGLSVCLMYWVGSLIILPSCLQAERSVVIPQSKDKAYSFFREAPNFKLWAPFVSDVPASLNYHFSPSSDSVPNTKLWDSLTITNNTSPWLRSAKYIKSGKDTLIYRFYLRDLLEEYEKAAVASNFLLRLVFKDTLDAQTKVTQLFTYPLYTHWSNIGEQHWRRFFIFYDMWKKWVRNQMPYLYSARS